MPREPQIPRKFEHFLKRKDEYNIIFPSEKVLQISPLHKLIPEVIRLSADPEDGDVWSAGMKKSGSDPWTELFSISKRGLQRIAQAAGIVFDPDHNRRTDDRRNPRRVEFEASGSIQKPDGSWYSVTHSKEIDLDQVEFQEDQHLRTEALDGDLMVGEGSEQRPLVYGTAECEEEIKRRLARIMNHWNKNKVAFADTGAHNRVIRELLILRPFYTAQEIARPFVMPRVALNVEFLLKNIDLKTHFVRGGLVSILQMFGPRERYEYKPERFHVGVSERDYPRNPRPTPTQGDVNEGGHS